ncbi:MAG: undecaprenyl-diphosphatase UppP [Deltaproteobacteria bacterium]
MDIQLAIILGAVEGITEFLPISSTGHMILTANIMGMKHTDFLKSFEIAIQLGAILAVVVLYWRELFVNMVVLKKVITAFIPTGIIGFALYKLIKVYLLGSSVVVLWALLIGGIVIIALEWWLKDKPAQTTSLEDISYKQALIIGTAQALAVIPGVSRSAATILGGLSLRIDRQVIVIFSFLLATPTMASATAYDLMKSGVYFSVDQMAFLAVGFVVSFVVALLTIKFLLKFVQTHTFIPFGIYRIVLVLIWLAVFGI